VYITLGITGFLDFVPRPAFLCVFEHTSPKNPVTLRILVVIHNFLLTTLNIIYRPIPNGTSLKMEATNSPETLVYICQNTSLTFHKKNNFQVIYNYAGTEVLRCDAV
jgi:hypothetical protein